MKNVRRITEPEIHPAYEAAIETQKMRVEDVRSIIDCVRHVLIKGNGEVEVTGAVIVACDMLNRIINDLDSVSLRAAAKQWRPTAVERAMMKADEKKK